MTKGTTRIYSLRRLGNALEVINTYMDRWIIQIDQKKTELMTMGRRKPPRDTLLIQTTRIPFKTSITYLGVTLDRKLNFKNHTHRKPTLSPTQTVK